MPADLSTMSALLVDDVQPGLRSQTNDDVPMLSMFENDYDTAFEGMEAVITIKVNRNRGGYATAEGGQAPTAGNQRLEKMRVGMRFYHHSIRITKQLMLSSRGKNTSAARGLQLEMDGLADDVRVAKNFHIWHFGTGIRCLLNGEPGTDTRAEVDSPGGVAGATNGVRYLNEGDHVVAINPASGLLRAGGTREITGVATDGTFFDVSAAIDAAWADNDYIVKAYGADASIAINNTEWNHPHMGLLGIVDNGEFVNSYFGLSRTSFPILQSPRIGSVGALSADVIQRGIDLATQLGMAKINKHWMEPSVLRAYLAVSQTDRRYTGGDLMAPNIGTKYAAGKLGPTGIFFGPAELCVDHWAPYGMWFGCDTQDWVRWVMDEGSWINEDGAVLTRVGATAVDTFDATWRLFDQFGSFRPNRCFRLAGISSNIVVVHSV